MRTGKVWIICNFALLIAVLLILSGCAKPEPATLPAGWPEPAVRLPSDATKELLPEYVVYEGPEVSEEAGVQIGQYNFPWGTKGPSWQYEQGKRWSVGFDTGLSWEKCVAHFDSVLLPAGYTEFHEDSSDPTFISSKSYVSSDGMKWINLARVSTKHIPGESPFYVGHELLLFELTYSLLEP